MYQRRAILYHSEVRAQIRLLRGIDEAGLKRVANAMAVKRRDWVRRQMAMDHQAEGESAPEKGYRMLLAKLGIAPEEAPIIERTNRRFVFASQNFCPTLEACNILGLDTRWVCRHMTEGPTEALLREVDPRLRFSREYNTLRPHGPYCRETVYIAA